MKFGLLENNIITQIIIADSEESITNPGVWIECPDDLGQGSNYMEYLRSKAYVAESDPLYFKWKRGEVTEQQWLDKVAEIKTRYPE
jgi:hypothetical protein